MSVLTSALPVRAEDQNENENQKKKDPSLVEPWLDATAADDQLLEQVIQWYRRCLAGHTLPQQALARRGLTHPELWATFEIGFADRRLGRRLPGAKTVAGRKLRARLQALGVLRDSGHGHFNGSVTFPLRDAQGKLVDVYGRKIGRNLIRGTELHTYLPDTARAGVFHPAAFQGTDTIVLADSPLNALSFWCAELRAVTCTLHGQEIGADLLAMLEQSCISRVLVAFRNTKPGVIHAENVAARLKAQGLQVQTLTFPANRDANDVLLQSGAGRLLALVRDASGRNGAAAPTRPATFTTSDKEQTALHAPPSLQPTTSTDIPPSVAKDSSEDTREKTPEKSPERTPDDQKPNEERTPSTGGGETKAAQPPLSTNGEIKFVYDDRHYRVRGLDKNLSLERLKINLRVSRDDLFHVNLFDLYSASARKGFIREAASEIYVPEEVIKRDLGHILDRLETIQQTLIRATLEAREPEPVGVSGPDRDMALALWHDGRLMDRILDDFERLGIVGEAANKQLCYLACVSRLLVRPLAVLLQSSSAAGKTTLMDATLRMMPPEDVVRYSAMTGQSLYYMGQKNIRHKILAVAEEEGVSQASYALKLLQSDGRLRIASAGKDDQTGRQRTQEYEVEGPVMMFLTTTSERPDPELQNRCLTLRVNESPQQTAAIHASQRARYTLEGQQHLDQCAQIWHLHQNAQRLLRPYQAVIPWAKRLTFRRDQTHMRRDNEKYLSLIATITLLHQYQRKTVRDAQGTQRLVATLADVELAGQLLSETMGQSVESLLPETRHFLEQLDAYVARRAEEEHRHRMQVRFKQRELRESLGISDFSLRKHLARLVELEYVLAYRTGRGNERQYELLYEGKTSKPFSLGLITTKELAQGNYDG